MMSSTPASPATSAATATVLHADGIVKRFGTTTVLDGVSLQARQGDVIAMIGASGSGKSTFLRCLNLLEQPNAGTLRVPSSKSSMFQPPSVSEVSVVKRNSTWTDGLLSAIGSAYSCCDHAVSTRLPLGSFSQTSVPLQ
jgi:ABC-type bacteriocin/lantibiotic exporter with double-glycine peptidase domain